MIPILYRSDEINFTSNGLGRLTDCISCTVTEERNGIYECEFQYPVTGRFYTEMVENGGIVAVTHDDHHDIQPFDIYKYTAPINGIVTFNASHISYRLNNIIVKPFTAPTCAAALLALKTQAANLNPFTFGTDKNVSSSFTLKHPANVRSLLAGQQGSILDVYGTGEYEFDKWSVYLRTRRGSDTGVTIRYGKNLSDITREKDKSGTYTAVAPYWTDGTTTVYLPEISVTSGAAPIIMAPWTDENGDEITDENGEVIYFQAFDFEPIQLDMSSSFESQPTEAELRQAAVRYLENNEPWMPSDNITVDFVALWQTPEYEGVASLQRVGLCDTVSVYYPALGVIAEQQKVIKVVYNVLLDVYDSMELGTAKTTLSQALVGNVAETVQLLTQGMNERPTESEVQAALDRATQLLSGGLGGYVVINTNANGEPQEILIMDSDELETAVSVIRLNKNGIGFSRNGYDGPFMSAWTIDGAFVADFITAGTLTANLIRAGTIIDSSGLNYWDLESGTFSTQKGILGDFTITRSSLTAGNPDSPSSGSGVRFTPTSLKLTQNTDAAAPSYSLFASAYDVLWSYAEVGAAAFSQVAHLVVLSSGLQMSIGGSLALQTSGPTTSHTSGYVRVYQDAAFSGSLTVSGTKSRIAKTDEYGDRLLYCYETPSPLFGDIGEGVIDDSGVCYVFLDPILAETISTSQYQVFLQKYGAGECYVSERKPGYFVVTGEAGLSFGWELKAKQADFDQLRLERNDEYGVVLTDYGDLAADYIFNLVDRRVNE